MSVWYTLGLLNCIKKFNVQALLRTVEEGNVATPEEIIALCERVADCRNYKVCPGFQMEKYEQYKEVIRYDPKRVVVVDLPVRRIESAKCERWYPLSQRKGITKEKREASEVLCQECVQLH